MHLLIMITKVDYWMLIVGQYAFDYNCNVLENHRLYIDNCYIANDVTGTATSFILTSATDGPLNTTIFNSLIITSPILNAKERVLLSRIP